MTNERILGAGLRRCCQLQIDRLDHIGGVHHQGHLSLGDQTVLLQHLQPITGTHAQRAEDLDVSRIENLAQLRRLHPERQIAGGSPENSQSRNRQISRSIQTEGDRLGVHKERHNHLATELDEEEVSQEISTESAADEDLHAGRFRHLRIGIGSQLAGGRIAIRSLVRVVNDHLLTVGSSGVQLQAATAGNLIVRRGQRLASHRDGDRSTLGDQVLQCIRVGRSIAGELLLGQCVDVVLFLEAFLSDAVAQAVHQRQVEQPIEADTTHIAPRTSRQIHEENQAGIA